MEESVSAGMPVNEIPNDEIIFKIKFRSAKLLAYGLIFFSIRRRNKNFGFKQTIASLKPNVFDEFMIEQRWSSLKEKLFKFTITKMEMINQPITEDIMEALTETLKDKVFCEDVFDYAEKEKHGLIIELIKNKFADVIPGRIEMQCELETTLVSEDDNSADKKDEVEQPEEIDSTEKKFIKVQPIYDNLLGKKIQMLKKDDIIPLIPIDERYNEKFYTKLSTYKFGKIYATFVEFYKEAKEEFAVFNLGQNMFGRFTVLPGDSQKKIKYVLSKDESGVDKLKFITDNTFLFYLIIIGVSTILCILSWFYYNWYFRI